MRPNYFSGKRLQILLHILAWSIFIIIPVFVLFVYGDGNLGRLGHFYTNAVAFGVIFYINYFYLAPRFFFNQKKLGYFLLVTLLILLVYIILWQIDAYMFRKFTVESGNAETVKRFLERDRKVIPSMMIFRFVNFFFTSVLLVGFSLGLAVFNRLEMNEKKRKELEKQKLDSELAFLKNQVSPHFFFNTLNNIYSLIGMDTNMAQESVLKLSKLMRYLLYESEVGRTLLSHEIDFMKNYIDLMKLRLSSRVELKVDFPEEFQDIHIPPLLFIPFIENAFKHGVSYSSQSFIHIRMEALDNGLRFECVNSLGDSSSPDDGQHSGIGLENVQKRLRLLFPDHYQLDVVNEGKEFRVGLTIQTS